MKTLKSRQKKPLQSSYYKRRHMRVYAASQAAVIGHEGYRL